MLVQFMIKNVLSFKEETILDMTAIYAYKEHSCNLIDIGAKERFLRVAAIYGANASGKSNLYFAMDYFQSIIAKSLNNVDDGARTAIETYYKPFKFQKDNENSEFQIVVILGSFEYRYGFEYNSECIVTEWLYRKNLMTNRTAAIFERTTNMVEFGAAVRKECEIYKEQIPVETLALSFFNKLKLETEIFKEVYAGIMNTLVVPEKLCEDLRILQNFLPKFINYNNEKEKLLEFLNAIDT